MPSNGFTPDVVRYNLDYLGRQYGQVGNRFVDVEPLVRETGIIAHAKRADGALEVAVLEGRDSEALNLPHFNGGEPVTEIVGHDVFETLILRFAESYGHR